MDFSMGSLMFMINFDADSIASESHLVCVPYKTSNQNTNFTQSKKPYK